MSTPNDLLIEARERQPSPKHPGECLSRPELAQLVSETLYAPDQVRRSPFNTNYVGKLERGEIRWPDARYRAALREVLGVATDADLGFDPPRSVRPGSKHSPTKSGPTRSDTPFGQFAVSWQPNDPDLAVLAGQASDAVVVRVQLDGTEVAVPLDRRLLLQVGIASVVEQLQLVRYGDVLWAATQRPALAAKVTVSSPAQLDEILSHLREQWHALVKTDNLLGPRFALAGVLNQLDIVQGLLSALRGQQRMQVAALGAQYAESAAWLYEDSDNLAQAQHWTSRAMDWALQAGDVGMLAWVVFRRAQQAATAGDAGQVVGLAQTARRNEDQLVTPMRAAIRVQEAYGYALDGDDQAAQGLLDQAHTWAAGDTEGDARGGHGSYCTPSYIEIQRASCWLTTGKPKKAIALFEEGLRALPVVYQRNRAAALSRLAVAYVADGQFEQAASSAHAALPVARSAGSKRILDEIRGIGAELAPHQPLQGVAGLLDDLRSTEA